jgi:hypothetical protein
MGSLISEDPGGSISFTKYVGFFVTFENAVSSPLQDIVLINDLVKCKKTNSEIVKESDHCLTTNEHYHCSV